MLTSSGTLIIFKYKSSTTADCVYGWNLESRHFCDWNTLPSQAFGDDEYPLFSRLFIVFWFVHCFWWNRLILFSSPTPFSLYSVTIHLKLLSVDRHLYWAKCGNWQRKDCRRQIRELVSWMKFWLPWTLWSMVKFYYCIMPLTLIIWLYAVKMFQKLCMGDKLPISSSKYTRWWAIMVSKSTTPICCMHDT